jgi:hypothetical protein
MELTRGSKPSRVPGREYFSRFQIREDEPAEAIRKIKDNRPRQIIPHDFDPGLGNDRAQSGYPGPKRPLNLSSPWL